MSGFSWLRGVIQGHAKIKRSKRVKGQTILHDILCLHTAARRGCNLEWSLRGEPSISEAPFAHPQTCPSATTCLASSESWWFLWEQPLRRTRVCLCPCPRRIEDLLVHNADRSSRNGFIWIPKNKKTCVVVLVPNIAYLTPRLFFWNWPTKWIDTISTHVFGQTSVHSECAMCKLKKAGEPGKRQEPSQKMWDICQKMEAWRNMSLICKSATPDKNQQQIFGKLRKSSGCMTQCFTWFYMVHPAAAKGCYPGSQEGN